MGERMKAAGDGARRNGATIGTAIATIGAWVMSEYFGVEPPEAVVANAAALFGTLGTYIQMKL